MEEINKESLENKIESMDNQENHSVDLEIKSKVNSTIKVILIGIGSIIIIHWLARFSVFALYLEFFVNPLISIVLIVYLVIVIAGHFKGEHKVNLVEKINPELSKNKVKSHAYLSKIFVLIWIVLTIVSSMSSANFGEDPFLGSIAAVLSLLFWFFCIVYFIVLSTQYIKKSNTMVLIDKITWYALLVKLVFIAQSIFIELFSKNI